MTGENLEIHLWKYVKMQGKNFIGGAKQMLTDIVKGKQFEIVCIRWFFQKWNQKASSKLPVKLFSVNNKKFSIFNV